jgi:hypothetical protein
LLSYWSMETPGTIYAEGITVLGVASDGETVILGNTKLGLHNGWLAIDDATLSYLATHPTPEDW